MQPVLFVTNYAPVYRLKAFAELNKLEKVEFALVGGNIRHGGPLNQRQLKCKEPTHELGFPTINTSEKEIYSLATSGRYRAVIAGTTGRIALPSAWLGARQARIPFVLWSGIWRHPRTLAHIASYLPMRHIYRHADAIATYGNHVSSYIRSKGSNRPISVATQCVDNQFWGEIVQPTRLASEFQIMFSGRLSREKGLEVLIQAWRASSLQAPNAALVLVGDGPFRARTVATGAALSSQENALDSDAAHFPPMQTPTLPTSDPGVFSLGSLRAQEVRSLYAGSDVVVLASIRTRDFCEPWGLVVNEAFNQGVPVIASDAVGAAAGGLVRHNENGLIFPAGDAGALSQAICSLREDVELRKRLGRKAQQTVSYYTDDRWVAAMTQTLARVDRSISVNQASNSLDQESLSSRPRTTTIPHRDANFANSPTNERDALFSSDQTNNFGVKKV